MQANEATVEAVIEAIKASKKYRDTADETVRQLAIEAVANHKKSRPAEKAVRKRLHSIMAPYLGDPDYPAAKVQLTAAFATGDRAAIEATCRTLMSAHLSTQERLPILDRFFHDIFAVTGKPARLLDVACALGPLAYPWMGLPDLREFWAYDIHEPRIDFLNHYFALEGLPPLARVQDIALHLPAEPGDVALILKEMPRFERNYPGHGRSLLRALNVRHLVLSFPAVSTHGGRNLTARYRDFFAELIDGIGTPVAELLYDTELVCIAEKAGTGA
jgi:16S rRNA (guanine(1405)-N(7))-methyltransferase